MLTCPNWRCERRKKLEKVSSKKIGMSTRDKTDLHPLFDEVAMPAELIQSIFDEPYSQWPVRLHSRHKALANTPLRFVAYGLIYDCTRRSSRGVQISLEPYRYH